VVADNLPASGLRRAASGIPQGNRTFYLSEFRLDQVVLVSSLKRQQPMLTAGILHFPEKVSHQFRYCCYALE
jgi:hypothetical protein